MLKQIRNFKKYHKFITFNRLKKVKIINGSRNFTNTYRTNYLSNEN